MLRFGPDSGPVVVMALPLFEEPNRVRALMVTVLRHLADFGMASALPDLPGQGESRAALVDMRLRDWHDAFATATAKAGRRCYVFAVRGGALVDAQADAANRLYLSPEAGKTLVRDLLRARRAGALAAGERLAADDIDAPGPPLLLAGNLVDRELLRELMRAQPGRAGRVLRLFPDSGQADRQLAPDLPPDEDKNLPRYRSPWAASEPFTDQVLAQSLADEIAQWVRACEGC